MTRAMRLSAHYGNARSHTACRKEALERFRSSGKAQTEDVSDRLRRWDAAEGMRHAGAAAAAALGGAALARRGVHRRRRPLRRGRRGRLIIML